MRLCSHFFKIIYSVVIEFVKSLFDRGKVIFQVEQLYFVCTSVATTNSFYA